ncbi:GNAT family acetyltransferase [Paenibacillus riograndensis]|uniref:GNAT family acetyltransferase n=1 Tax=Paenibacillus riograndensis TaxID=483937 RepID=A0A132U9I2_9BACL|nr:GNAT family protein [Paenibacillus riograndensis]KWX80222.1 GNAT family acetyltransferase [Paenibacillus riograndensis]
MSTFETISTDRLIIRTLEMKDKDALFKYRSIPEVYKFQTWQPKEVNEVEKFISYNMAVVPNAGDTWLQVAISSKDGQLLGDIGIHYMDDGFHMELGYTLSPEFEGKGYASEAVRAVIDYVFSGLGKHRVTCSVDPDNLKSIRLLERLGFRKEAHFIKSYRMNNEWYDDCVYAILADEWK